MVASSLWHQVSEAKAGLTLAVGAPIFGTAVVVGLPPAGAFFTAPPVCVGANFAPVPFQGNLEVVLGLDVLDGPYRTSGGQRSNEGDFDRGGVAVPVRSRWRRSYAPTARTSASVGGGGGGRPRWWFSCGSGASGNGPLRDWGLWRSWVSLRPSSA